jgi:hypothetical protein
MRISLFIDVDGAFEILEMASQVRISASWRSAVAEMIASVVAS